MQIISTGCITEVVKVHNTMFSTEMGYYRFMFSATLTGNQCKEIKELTSLYYSHNPVDGKLQIIHHDSAGKVYTLQGCYITNFDIELTTQHKYNIHHLINLSVIYDNMTVNTAPGYEITSDLRKITLRTAEFAYDKAMGIIE